MKIGDLPLSIDGGVSPPCLDRPAVHPEKGVLRLSAVGGGQFAPHENKAVRPEYSGGLGPSVQADTVLMSRSNTTDLVGAVSYVPYDIAHLHLPDLIWRILPTRDNEICMRWLALALQAPTTRRALRRIASGTSGSMKKLSMRGLRSISLTVPRYRDQQLIADTLFALDKHRGLVRTLLATKRATKHGVMQQVLTDKRQLRGLADTWQDFRLGDLFKERIESARDDLPLLSITAERGIVSRDEIERRDTSNVNKGAYLRIAPGDIGYNTMRMWQGVSALSSLEGIVSPAYTVLIPGPLVDGAFAAQYFKYPPVINEFRRHSQGLVDDTLNLKFHHFARIRLPFPPLDEQRAIATALTFIDNELRLLDQLTKALDRQKRALLERLFSGEIQVPAT